jgi:uncharacterized protein (DUF2164 family)
MRDTSLSLSDSSKKLALTSIKRFFGEQLDQEIGDLKAILILDYILAEHGPAIYNRALADARAFIEERAGDVEGLGYPREYPSVNAPSKSR